MGADRRSSTRMSPGEVADYLREQPRSMTLATHNRHGSIHLVAMFYVVIDGDVWFWSYGSSQKIVNLRRNASVSVLVESGEEYSGLRGVHLAGRAEIIDDPGAVLDVGMRMALFQGRADDGETADAIARAGRKRVAVRVVAERTVSWDHRKLGDTIGL